MWKLTSLSVILLLSPAVMASPDFIKFPEGYKTTFTKYAVINRSQKKQVVHIYANKTAVDNAQPRQALPSGSAITMEIYKAKLDNDKQPLSDEKDHFITDALVAVVVMEKRKGWGTEYSDEIRNGEWEYAKFKPQGGKALNATSVKCLECHKPMGNKDFVFSYDALLELNR